MVERAPKPVGSWASLSEAVLARSQRVGLTAESLSAASASRHSSYGCCSGGPVCASKPLYLQDGCSWRLSPPPRLFSYSGAFGSVFTRRWDESLVGKELPWSFGLSGSVFILLLETGRGVGECPLPVTGKLPFFSRVNGGNGVTGQLSEDLQEAYKGENKGCVSAGGKRGGNRTQVSPRAPDMCCLGLPAT